ncbi:MAG: carboxypeptidase-like regulatory domain-containing protein, partial [bacterium]
MTGVPDGWQLEAVHLEGRDVIDTPLEFRGEASIEHVVLLLTDQLTELTGTVQDEAGDALTDFTVVAFPSDERLWQPRSRHILASRPDQNAQYRLRGLPPGDYLLAAVEIVEEGEWFEPRFLEELRRRATRVTLRDGGI